MALHFDRSLDAAAGQVVRLSPMIERVLAPNPGPFTFQGTGVYLVGAGDALAIVDPGPDMPEHLEALKRAIGRRTLSHILITHTHRDHSPAAAPLKAWSGARTYSSPIRALTTDAQEGRVDEAHDHAFVPDVAVQDGDIIAGLGFTFECVATPGHTAGHLCFALDEERALFSGDHVMGWSTSVVAPPDGDMAEYIASLEKLAARSEGIFYPTHGSPIASPQEYVHELIMHRRQRAAQITSALARGTDSVAALTAKLYPDIMPVLTVAAATQIQAHLDQMEREGTVIRTQTKDGLSYRLSS